MLTTIETPEQYRRLVTSIFEDGIINKGRWIILDLFTKDLCERRPEHKQTIMKENSHLKSKFALIETTNQSRVLNNQS